MSADFREYDDNASGDDEAESSVRLNVQTECVWWLNNRVGIGTSLSTPIVHPNRSDREYDRVQLSAHLDVFSRRTRRKGINHALSVCNCYNCCCFLGTERIVLIPWPLAIGIRFDRRGRGTLTTGHRFG